MAQFNKRKSHAERMEVRTKQLRKNGRHDLVKPLESHRVDHTRVLDSWRENKPQTTNGKAWKGAKGKQKKQVFLNT